MCDEHIHQGLTHDPTLTRRAFGLGAAAAVALTSARANAEAKVVEKDVNVPMASGVSDSALFYPEGKGSWPAVLIWTDILGLRPVFREMGRRLAAEGYVVLVPNPFYRKAKSPVVDGTFDFNKPEDRAKVMPLAASVTAADANISDAKDYLKFLDTLPQTNKKKKIGVQGYCMGGPLTYRTAAVVSDRVGAAATFHGGGLVTDKPDSPHLVIPQMKAEVYSAVAANDDERDPKAKDVLKESFAAAKVPAKVEVYPGCAHGWTVKGSQVYNEPGAEKAWTELLALYKRRLA
ncbi:dienelactone hydrolase family protein [Terriglobus tenax]|uniref:dienelactone hydrolase family protein n=1 Tax=Terriglobus tenax TaxID=1111115 RepID=UPI0021DF7C1B|nr:dienelactone hydrolase family protein [Terriglobus tenax]